MDSELKKCPFCAEEIKKEAIKCKHCGEYLNNINLPELQQKKSPIQMFFLIIAALFTIIILSVIGFFIGYSIFGKVLGEYIPISYIFDIDSTYLEAAIQSIRVKILISSLVGGVCGFLLSLSFLPAPASFHRSQQP